MNHELYIFGSAIRGEVSRSSDVDILVIPFTDNNSLFPIEWSVYSPGLVEKYYQSGRLFAWHLHLEAKCIYTPNPIPFLHTLGVPAPYSTINQDINELECLLLEAVSEIQSETNNLIYELGIVYTAVRDIAMSASWALLKSPCFSRRAPYMLPISCPLQSDIYENAMMARHCSSRGYNLEIDIDKSAYEIVRTPWKQWVKSLREAI